VGLSERRRASSSIIWPRSQRHTMPYLSAVQMAPAIKQAITSRRRSLSRLMSSNSCVVSAGRVNANLHTPCFKTCFKTCNRRVSKRSSLARFKTKPQCWFLNLLVAVSIDQPCHLLLLVVLGTRLRPEVSNCQQYNCQQCSDCQVHLTAMYLSHTPTCLERHLREPF